MDVRQQPEAETFEGRRQTVHRDDGPDHVERAALVEEPVGAGPRDGADSRGQERLQHGAPADCHRLL